MKKFLTLVLSLAMAFTLIINPMYSVNAEEGTIVNTAEELQAALTNGDTSIIIAKDKEIDGTKVSFTNSNNVTISGQENAVLNFESAGSNKYFGRVPSGITFKDLTIKRSNNTYQGFTDTTDETYINCTITGQMFAWGQGASFTNCTFEQTSNDAYNIWTYSADVDFTGCTFNSAGKSVLIYNEGHNATFVTFNDCEFNASESVGKSAIEIGSEQFSDNELENGLAFDVTINNCIVNGFSEGNNSGNTLWNNKLVSGNTPGIPGDNVTVRVDGDLVLIDGIPVDEFPIIVTNENEISYYLTLEEAISAAQDGDTITLLEDITLTTKFNVQKDVTIDLNGNTLTLTTTDNDVTGTNDVEIINGTISLQPTNNAGDGIIRVGVRSNTEGGSLTLTDVIVEGEDISSGAGTIVVYSNAEFTMVSSELNIADENSSQAYMIYANDKKLGEVNIIDSKINGTNVNGGLFNGTILIDGSTVILETKDNGINQNENGLDLTIIDSEVEITKGAGRALTLYGDECIITITNSKLSFAQNEEADIRYKTASTGQIVVTDKNSSLTFGTVVIDGDEEVTIDDILATMKLPTCETIAFDDDTSMYSLVFEHDLDLVDAKDATCTIEGYTGNVVCSICGDVIEEGSTIKALGHTEGEVVGAKEATCTEKGHTGTVSCTVCNEVLDEGKEIEALGHTYKDGKCTVCNAEDPNYVSTKTGDTNMIIPTVGTLLLSGAILVLLKKKEELVK